MIFVEFIDHFLGMGEYPRVPHERSVFRVPSGGAEARSEKNHGVARQFSFAESFGLLQNFFPVGQGAMRLLVAEAPQRRLFRVASKRSVLGHDGFRIAGANQKYIERQGIFEWMEP